MTKSGGLGQGGSQPEDEGKGKEVKPLTKTEGPEAILKLKNATHKAKNTASKAKEANPNSMEVDPKAINPFVSQPGSKEDPSLTKA